MRMSLRKMAIENFKGIHSLDIDFGESRTAIKGQNASGKSTVVDAVSWLLFGTNANGDTKFEIRPLDEHGNTVDKIDIHVQAAFTIDGKEVELSRTQKQKWVKHRNQEFAKFEGNVDEYSIDGYPKSAKDYNTYVASVVDTKVFKMLVNPSYFANLPWKEQREELMKFVSSISDLDLAKSETDFAPLIPEIEKAPSLDDIQKKYAVTVKSLKQKQTEIPIRIDEVAKTKVDLDTAELEQKRNALNDHLAEVGKMMESGSNRAKIDKLEQEKFELQFSINDKKRELLADFQKEKQTATDNLIAAEVERDKISGEIEQIEKSIAEKTELKEKAEAEKDSLGAEYKIANASLFDGVLDFDEDKWTEPDTVCPYCGQELPADQKDKLIAEHEEKKAAARKAAEDKLEVKRQAFQTDKKKRLDEIKEHGFALKNEIEELDAYIEEYGGKLPELKEQEKAAAKKQAELRKKADSIAEQEVDLESDPSYKTLIDKDAELAEKISVLRNSEPDVSKYEAEKKQIQMDLDEVNRQLAKSANNIAIDERIAELETELRETSQKVADCEKILYLLEKFIKAKLNRVSEMVNSHFKVVRWKLFKTLINGGLQECCEMEAGGVPYSSLNTGSRIMGGLDVINALSELYEVQVPVFLDNAECLSSNNAPAMDCQLVLLEVTDDKQLVVESVA